MACRKNSTYNDVLDNQTNRNATGIYLYTDSDNNKVIDNRSNLNVLQGIYLYFADFNTVSYNTTNRKDRGIQESLVSSIGNTYVRNVCKKNDDYDANVDACK